MNTILLGLVNFYFFYILFLLFFMFTKRKAAIKNKQVKMSRFKGYTGETTEQLQIIKNHIENQFQLPVIFFIAILFVIQQNSTNLFSVILAVLFVVSRLAHSYIHLGSNHLIHRAFSYFLGLLCVGGLFLQSFFSTWGSSTSN